MRYSNGPLFVAWSWNGPPTGPCLTFTPAPKHEIDAPPPSKSLLSTPLPGDAAPLALVGTFPWINLVVLFLLITVRPTYDPNNELLRCYCFDVRGSLFACPCGLVLKVDVGLVF